MRNEFTAIIERDGKWFIAYSPEVPGANGQGRTKAAARKSLGACAADGYPIRQPVRLALWAA